jgi:hypothetical protein
MRKVIVNESMSLDAPEEEQIIAEPLNTTPKYVASRTLIEPLEWQSSTLLQGDVAEAVAAPKQEGGYQGTVRARGGSPWRS